MSESEKHTPREKVSEESAKPHDWLRHSYEVQSRLLEGHPRRQELEEIGKLVSEEIVQIFGAFLREKHLGAFQQRAKEEPTVLGREIGNYVGETVARILAADPEWPGGNSGTIFHRREVVVLTPVEIKSLVRHEWYMNAAAFSSWEQERGKRPGWEFRWLLGRVKKVGVLVEGPVGSRGGPGGGRLPAPNLEFVVVNKDGSALVKFEGEPIIEHGAVPAEEQLPALVTRRYRRSPNADQWRSEMTHEWIEGKGWIRITDQDGEEH